MSLERRIDTIQRLKYAFVVVLREAFSSLDPTGDGYNRYYYSQKEPDSKIAIYHAFPLRFVKYPTIVIVASRANASIEHLQDEEVDDLNNYDATSNVNVMTFAGKVMADIEIHIFTETTIDRSMLTDLITFWVRHLFKDKFRDSAICEYAGITISGESQSTLDERIIYENTITVNCFTEYVNQIDYSLINRISKLNIDLEIINLEES